MYRPTNPLPPLLDFFGHPCIIYGVYQMNKVGKILDLVALKVTNEMPSDAVIQNLLPLMVQLLDVTLTDVEESGRDGFPHNFGPETLGDPDQQDVFGFSSAAYTRFKNAF